MKWTLQKRLLFAMFALILSITIVNMGLSFYAERRLKDKLQKKTEEITEAIHLSVEEITRRAEDPMSLYNRLKELKPEAIKEINLIDEEAKIKASTNPFVMGQRIDENTTNLIFQSELGEFVTKEGEDYILILPVITKGEHQGYIQVILDTSDIEEIFHENEKRKLFLSLGVLFCSLAIVFWLSKRYTKPIRDVSEAARRIASGDFDILLSPGDHDEIGLLKESFNHMIKKLKEAREFEKRLRETEHLATVGEISKELAHELKNPLNFINLTVDHLIQKCGDQGELLHSIKEEVSRMNSLVNNFLTYGRPLRLNKRKTELKELVESVVLLINQEAKSKDIQVEKGYPEEPFFLEIDPDMTRTALLNILKNSIESIDHNGKINIDISREGSEPVKIRIRDTGKGMDEETLQKATHPLFTTKPDGVGLGLSISKRIIEEQGGRIEIKSTPGHGTEVNITLPQC